MTTKININTFLLYLVGLFVGVSIMAAGCHVRFGLKEVVR